MNYRTLGSTNIKVSEIGFGAWQLGNEGWGGLGGDDAIRLVHEAIDMGCNFFDTAPGYGEGQSEILLGKALKEKRQQVVIVSKFGHNPDGTSDFSADKIRAGVERTLKALQTDYLDGLLLHNPERAIMHGEGEHYDVMESLKQEGLIRSYGASLDTSEDLKAVINNSYSQICEILFNALNQEVGEAFDEVTRNNVGLIVKVPLDSGWLSGKYTADSVFTTGYRDRWTAEVKQRRFDLIKALEFLKTEEQTMSQGALRFILDYPEISTIIPGMKNFKHMRDNLKASEGRLTFDEVNRIKGIWQEQIKNNPLGW